MKLAIIANSKSYYAVKRIIQEASPLFDDIDCYTWRQVSLNFKNNTLLVQLGYKEFSDYTHLLTRFSEGYHLQRYILLNHAHDLNIGTINYELVNKLALYNKLTQYYLLSKAGLPVVPTIQTLRLQGLQLPFDYPVIVKQIVGSKARKVKKVDNLQQLEKTLKGSRLTQTFLQPYLTDGYDIRVIVAKGKILGAYKRVAVNDFRTTIQGDHLPCRLSSTQEDVCLSASKVLGAQYLGFDLMNYNGKPAILEVNIDAGFKVFEDVTKVNVAKAIVDLIVG